MKRFIFLTLLLGTVIVPVWAGLQAGIGYNTPTGTFKSDTEFPGGASFLLGGEMPILFMGLGGDVRYHILGDTVSNLELPEYPGVTYDDVTIKSYIMGGDAFLRLYPVQSNIISVFGELSFGYYHRGFQIQNLPVPTDLGAQDGTGYGFGVGAKILPVSPIKPFILFRYETGIGVGRSDFDALSDPESDQKKNATFFNVMACVDIL